MRRAPVPSPMIFLVMVVLTLAVGVDLARRGLRTYPLDPVWEVHDGDPARGRQAILSYGCIGCHTIPGIRGATGRVGPQLIGLREQLYLAGVRPNTPENLVSWIQYPRRINPLTAMPELGVTEADARDIAAYLYSRPR